MYMYSSLQKKEVKSNKSQEIKILEIDKLYTYILKKQKTKKIKQKYYGKKYCDKIVQTTVDRNRDSIIVFKVGDNSISNDNISIYNNI